MITIGACSPPCSSSVMASALVDSASPGRNDVDSLFSASLYLPGRLAPNETNRKTSAVASTTHFAVRPAATVRSLAMVGMSFRWGVRRFYKRVATGCHGAGRTLRYGRGGARG